MFEGIKRSYVLLVLMLMEVIEELGSDRGIEMLQTAVERHASIVANELRRSICTDMEPLEVGEAVYTDFMEGAGAEVTIHERDETSVTFMVRRCPFYEAFLEVGVDCGYFLGGLCSNLTLPSIQAILSRFNPRLKLETVLVRETAEELCLERLSLDEE
jgi:predicted ArsR family transcriptional regulator